MNLKELIEAPPGAIIKGFVNIRTKYADNIKTNIISPSFSGWHLEEKQTRQTFGYVLIKKFNQEEDLIVVNRRTQSFEDCLKTLSTKEFFQKNRMIFEDYKWSLEENAILIRLTSEEIPGMLLGDFFTVDSDPFMPVTDNFFLKLYAKIIVGDKIGWLSINVLLDEYDLEIE